MKNLSNKLAVYIAKKNLIKNDDIAFYQYGLQLFLEFIINFTLSVLIAVILNMKIECFVFFLFFIPIRLFNGGLHLKSFASCSFLSCITLTVVLLILKYFDINANISIIVYILSALILKTTGPVNHKNRIVGREENLCFIKRMNLVLLFSTVCAICFYTLGLNKYLFLESLVFLIVLITTVIGKFNVE